MKLPVLFVFILLAGAARAQDDNLTIKNNEGIELMSVVQYLGGHDDNNTNSPYKTAVQEYFWKYRNEPAVKTMFTARFQVFSDLVECGLAFYGFPDIRFHPVADSCTWVQHLGRDTLDRYMQECTDFYRTTHFHEFYTSHQYLFRDWARSLRDSAVPAIRIFDSLINIRRDHHWLILMDPLNGWGAHTIIPRYINPAYRNCFIFQLGYFGDTNKLGNMVGDADLYDFGWHEGTHAFTDSILEEFKTNIDSLSDLLSRNGALKGQNIEDWPHYFNELMAYAVSAALCRQFRPKEYERQIKGDLRRGFVHIQTVSDVIYENYIHARKVDNFEGLMPLIFAALRKSAKPAGS